MLELAGIKSYEYSNISFLKCIKISSIFGIMSKQAVIIGGGFGGLSSAALLARDGWDVTVVEKLDEVGGRARPGRPKGMCSTSAPRGI